MQQQAALLHLPQQRRPSSSLWRRRSEPPLPRVRHTRLPLHHPACCSRAQAPLRAAAIAKAATPDHEVLLFDFHDQQVPYEQAWAWQRRRVDAIGNAESRDRRDTVLLLQHPPTYTLGAGSTVDHVRFDLEDPPHPIYRTERGGEVTYHGPGQLVMYPILDLSRHKQDLHWYLRSLEEVVIRTLSSVSGLEAERIDGLTGVWVNGSKLAAIGVRARRWVTYHGLALNVCTDLAPFGSIVPCGIGDRPVGSVETALGREPAGTGSSGSNSSSSSSGSSSSSSRNDSSSSSSRSSGSNKGAGRGDVLSGNVVVAGSDGLWSQEQRALLAEYRYALLEKFEEVFELRLTIADNEEVDRLLLDEDGGADEEAVPGTAAAVVGGAATL